MTVYMLGYCSECDIRYAIMPDPRFPIGAQYFYFDRDISLAEATHVCSGGFLCLLGHELELTAPEAVYTESGRWVEIPPYDTLRARNN